ncbi:bis-aminopropyl spermidine synthase family protein [Amycolatopsis sp. 195334CR]|uniref:bis-aminopropyl spermidine synthase family protein n=1 Tax=Amycolatopsis sp. 195334CR TaxID=2814588 RepID=UPI001A8DD641|nr:bis-aminopropyl spermidine synthase family protein [Amycolatopsis sp. 195334CR]MBN6034475.1 bis-aminopropyl spermidine synthase family protein [Amycolatopsis sp. 195334CR]
MSSLNEVLASHGVHQRPLRTALALLGDGWIRFDELIRRAAAPRRSVEELLDSLGADLERDGDAVRLRPSASARYAEFRPRTEKSAPDLLAEMTRLIERVPPPLPALDHVQATAETVVRRAVWLDAQYELGRLLFLGDHDLTSLAVHRLRPDAELTVVDLDERVLAYVEEHSGGAIRTLHADLRVGLPHAVAGSADLVFSDPPYTPEGMGLFAARGVEALADPPLGRLLLAYGYSPRHPALGAQVQQELLRLGLTFEAILPDFHAYHGAQAIGAAADLYVCQPTAKARKQKVKQGIYTHGPQSVESAGASAALMDRVRELAERPSVETARADWSKPINGEALAFDLRADPGPWLLRVLLAANAPRLAVLVPNSHPDLVNAEAQAALHDLVGRKYRLKLLRSLPDNKHAVVVADLVDSPAVPLTRAHARLANVPGVPLALHPYRLIDLPRHVLQDLLPTL